MKQLNSIIIEGNLAQETELTKTPSGMEVYNLPIAVNRFHKNSNGEEINEVSFFDIQGHGKLAEVLSQTKKVKESELLVALNKNVGRTKKESFILRFVLLPNTQKYALLEKWNKKQRKIWIMM